MRSCGIGDGFCSMTKNKVVSNEGVKSLLTHFCYAALADGSNSRSLIHSYISLSETNILS